MIEASGLTKTYGRTTAVNDLSFQVQPGVVTGFLGPNGSGKSTTMRMILGLDSPDRGRALIDGQRYVDLKHPLEKIGSLLDANWVHPNRTASSHLRWMARANGLSRRRVDEVLDTVGLSSVAGKAAGKYSLGMKQRLGIASALLGDPEVLLFDEPVNGLDPEGIHWIRTFMQGLARQGRTVFVSSHLLSEMALTADHLIVIGRGQMIADASTKDFIAHSTEASVIVRSPQLDKLRTALQGLQAAAGPGNAMQPGGMPTSGGPRLTETDGALSVVGVSIERIGELAAQQGIALHELSPQSGSLEEAFIQLTNFSTEYTAHSPVPQGAPAQQFEGSPMQPPRQPMHEGR
ncbi:MAG: ABC transporter ATP-binding protein [Actinomycetota bacterium]|nr:ABC transporter ATP-binding protein [Actinomycetota bacterium]